PAPRSGRRRDPPRAGASQPAAHADRSQPLHGAVHRRFAAVRQEHRSFGAALRRGRQGRCVVRDEAVAARYAQAIFELGVEGSNLSALTSDVRKMAEAYAASNELRVLLGNPLINEEARVKAVSEIADRLGLSALGKNAVGLLTQ